jgi:TonB family protein
MVSSTQARKNIVVAGYVGTDGKFHAAKVKQSIGDATLDAKALNAVKTWKFRPCTKTARRSIAQ